MRPDHHGRNNHKEQRKPKAVVFGEYRTIKEATVADANEM